MATSLAQSHQCRCLIESDKLCESTKTKLCLALHNLGVITPDFRMSESRCGHHRYQHSTKSLKTARQKILPSPGAVCRLAKEARALARAILKEDQILTTSARTLLHNPKAFTATDAFLLESARLPLFRRLDDPPSTR
ncbi:hypothetical protein PGTUg99_021840 [Puccinia graminis f. sp. tritici]|uniref:Uncharacterized protein n=1 Tax=Puccinia graminis f. sp. tritici TaxID=56615 RepID=A0A5B0RR55_PUCGR|nr:hypothetical protein PGTUg99_021840 [Puccinia graminis f. sp. tritici]